MCLNSNSPRGNRRVMLCEETLREWMAGPSSGPLVPSLPGINRSDLKNQTLVNLLSTFYVLVMELDFRNKEAWWEVGVIDKGPTMCQAHYTCYLIECSHRPREGWYFIPFYKERKGSQVGKRSYPSLWVELCPQKAHV